MALQVWLHGKDLINNGLCPNNATWVGPATYADGKLGKCYSCTGSHYISYTYDFASTNKFTIAFWIYIPTSLSTCNQWERVFYFQNYVINWADYNNLKIYDNSSNQLWWLDGNMFYDKWVHLTIAHNADTITLYINGDHYATVASTSSPISSGIMYAGDGITDEHGPVKFNDIRLYDHCLSPKEVKEIAKGLVLHYPLNDAACSKNLASDTDWERTSSNEYMNILESYQDAGIGEYTFSCEMKVAAGTPSVNIYWSDGEYTRKYNYSVSNIYTNGVLNGKLSQQWQKVICKLIFTVSTEDSTVMPHISTYYTYGSGAIVSVRNPKLEKGWNPNPIYTNSSYNTVYDCSGYQNNGTITGSLSCSADSPRYKISTHFTSSIPSRIMLPSDMSCLSSSNEQTLSCWVKSSGLGSGMLQSGLIALGYGNSLFLSDSDYYYRIDNGANLNSIRANQNPHDRNWHLVTATYKSGVASIYIDGVLKNSVSRTFSNRYINNGVNCIGTEANNPKNYNINGDISDIRMYATALSAEDIKELYNTSCIINS